MSVLTILAIIRWARRQRPEAGAVAKNVLNALATYADRAGRCWPGQEELAGATGYNVRSVRLALRQLEEAGYLRRSERRRRDRTRDTDLIELVTTHDDAPERRPEQPAEQPAPQHRPTGTPQQTNRNPTADQPARDSGPTSFEDSREESTERSDPSGSAPEPGASRDFRSDLFERGTRIVRALTGRSEPKCRTLIGSWLSLCRDDAVTVLRVIDEAESAELADPVSWIEKRLKAGPRPGFRPATPAAKPATSTEVAARQAQAEAMAARGEWPTGGTLFVAADSPEGLAWEAYYRPRGVRCRWVDCGRTGRGWYMPSALPPSSPAAAAA